MNFRPLLIRVYYSYRATTILFCVLQHTSRTDSGVVFDDQFLHTIVTPIKGFWFTVMLEGPLRKIDHTLKERARAYNVLNFVMCFIKTVT
jgi:hypothetical protein